MDRNTLFKQLAEHYELDPNTDWWKHKQSGSWVLSHAAVKKLSSIPTPDGMVIKPPKQDQIVWIKDGSTEGPCGKEIVIGATFSLVNKTGQIVRSSFAIGEANEKNVGGSVPYPWAMAWKRMFDRGVLDVLAFAQLQVYSASEADTFNDPVQRVKVDKPAPVSKPKPEPKPEPVVEVKPKPVPQPPKQMERPVPQPPKVVANKPVPKPPAMKPPVPAEKKTEVKNTSNPVESNEKLILDCLNGKDESGWVWLSRSEVMERTGLSRNQFSTTITRLVDSGKVVREGNRSTTRYSLPREEKLDMNEETFSSLWKDVLTEASRLGVPHVKVRDFTKEVTGCDTAAEAFDVGTISMGRVETIYLMVQNWAASNMGAPAR